jgi:hypothetical protein
LNRRHEKHKFSRLQRAQMLRFTLRMQRLFGRLPEFSTWRVQKKSHEHF